ncbi:antiviral reverse transcriptase Drt3a [Ruegeria sp. Ofav3-42]|uniref:antiviral reverse transcriptase Drt3a n=1 Tax=Ruegeria sp. Ofav3-42 TaxID=2917759 RepID=UPI00351D76A1
MLDASFRFKSLMQVVSEQNDPIDFAFPSAELNLRIDRALTQANTDGPCFDLRFTKRKGREICVPRDFETAILLRRLNENVRRITRVRQNDRNYIVSCLSQLLGNGLPFVVARYDIKKFYASIDRDELRRICSVRLRSSGTTRRMLEKFLSDLDMAGASGIPAGLALSGTLSELFLSEMDKRISRSQGVHFYSRYVDDIVIVADPNLTDFDLTERIFDCLPSGLRLNSTPGKKYFILLPKKESRGGPSEYSFDYLGYNLTTSKVFSEANHDKTLNARKLTIDISKSKINKRKTRFILSIKQYLRDGNQDDLMDRFLLINSGYRFYDRSSGRRLSGGMCNSYPLIDHPSPALRELSSFYSSVFSSRSSSLAGRLALAPLTRRNRKRIQYFDLCAHVQQKKYVGFDERKLSQLMGVWRHA